MTAASLFLGTATVSQQLYLFYIKRNIFASASATTATSRTRAGFCGFFTLILRINSSPHNNYSNMYHNQEIQSAIPSHQIKKRQDDRHRCDRQSLIIQSVLRRFVLPLCFCDIKIRKSDDRCHTVKNQCRYSARSIYSQAITYHCRKNSKADYIT